ncbi:MAG: hypothetical protein E7437_01020 [Ruminococcaceae bacterium]|nr:hypothetical protein [Oscillospiraceae bacterium]
MKKRILCFLLIVLLAVSLLPISGVAAGSPRYSISGKTVQTGDVFTVDVAISDNPGIISLRFRVVYDASVLQLQSVADTRLLNGYTTPAPTVTSPYTLRWADSLATTDNTAQGTVVTLTFKALKAASACSVSIEHGEARNASGTKVTFSGASAAVTVACNHSYGDWTNAGAEHQKVCSDCGDLVTASHTWNSGTVTKPATCKETGEKTYTCTDCGATKTETVAKTDSHSYGGWIQANDTTHKHICSVCQKEESENHTWDKGTTVKQANCKEGGQIQYTCSGCKATKLEDTDKTTTHTYAAWIKVNDTTHKHTCSVCSKEETANHTWNSGSVTKQPTCKEEGEKTYTCTGCNGTKTEAVAKLTTHTYDHACDTDCNVCGATRTTTHSYKTFWSSDRTNHWHECSACKDKKDVAAHTPGAQATETKAQTCTTCGYILKAALGHKHSYATTWTTDDAGHWYACSGCAEKGSYADHDFENACDPDCSICGFTRETAHKFEESWSTDADNHWHVCTECGIKQEIAAHEPGAEATATTAQTCTICGYEIAPALGQEETTEAAEPTETTEGTTPAASDDANESEDGSFPWWLVIVAAVILSGVIVVIAKKKKK